MRAVSFFGLVAVLGQASCGARATVDSKLGQRIEDLAQQESSLQKQIEEMQNRLFLLEDKVDTSRVAIERSKPPELPVVRLRPSEPEKEEGGEGTAREGAVEESAEPREEEPVGGRSVVARRSIVYDGDASRSGPRPVLRLQGSETGGGGTASLAGPDPAGVSEKLPVVPLPSRAVARRQADVQPMQEYQSALAKYRAGEYAAAADAFRGFFQRYGQHAYADNALYWLAECSYDLKHYRLALKFFRQVVEQYPGGNKAPDALLKMAYCYVQMNDKRNARAILAQVIESYPRSQVAKLASATMAKL